MLQAFGRDRIETLEDGRVEIRCLHSKGWIARSAKTPTSAEHPGTAVRWEDQFFEVMAIEPLAPEGIRYLLSPWDEKHVFRVVSNYDDASEKIRALERRASDRRQRNWITTLLLAPLTGLLPGSVQERMEREFGAPGPLLTFISLILPFFFGGFCFVWLLIMSFVGASGSDASKVANRFLTIPVILIGSILFFETIIRVVVSVSENRPVGSILGIVPYALFRAVRPRGATAETQRFDPKILDAPPDRDAREREREDLYRAMRAPLSFLSSDDQIHLAERFGFDPAHFGKLTALIVGTGAAALLMSSILAFVGGLAGLGSLLVLPSSGYLLVEQVRRLRKSAQGLPAPSVLGGFVRPLVLPLFEKEPEAVQKAAPMELAADAGEPDVGSSDRSVP